MNTNKVLGYLKHLAILGALAAAAIILNAILGDLKVLNLSHASPTIQGIAAVLLPTLITAGLRLQSEIQAEEQAQVNAKLVKENSSLRTKLVSATAAAQTPATPAGDAAKA